MTKCSFMPQQKAAPACLPPASWVESTRSGPASELGPRCASESLRRCQPGPRSHVSVLHTYRQQEREESLVEATPPHPVSERTEPLQASRTTDLPAEVHQPACRAAHARSHTHSHVHIHTHTRLLPQRHAHTPRRTHSLTHTLPDTHAHIYSYPDTHTPRHTHTHSYIHTLTYTYPHTRTHTHHTDILKHTHIHIHIPHSHSHTPHRICHP